MGITYVGLIESEHIMVLLIIIIVGFQSSIILFLINRPTNNGYFLVARARTRVSMSATTPLARTPVPARQATS